MKFALKSFGIFVLFQAVSGVLVYKMDSWVVDAVVFLIYIAQVVCLFKRYRRSCSEDLGMGYNAKSILHMITFSVALYFCFTMVESGFLSYLAPDYELSMELSLISIIYLTSFGPLSEELIFRGIFLNQLNKKYSFLAANIIQASIFSLLHFDAYVFLFGVLFGFSMGMLCRHFNLYFAVLIHVINNVQASVMKDVDIVIPRTAYLIIGIVFVVPTVVLLWRLKDYRQPGSVAVDQEA